jgi:hypothetical protein
MKYNFVYLWAVARLVLLCRTWRLGSNEVDQLAIAATVRGGQLDGWLAS